jgi:diguanylate cyclase (GGDEF)-like protein
MNSMTSKVKQMFDEQAQIAERLRKNAYSDVLTGLGNRRYLQGQVSAGMDMADTSIKGAFLLVQVHNLQKLHQERGYQFADHLLQQIAECIRVATRDLKNSALSRISGGSFAIFMPNATEEAACRAAGAITRGFAGLASENIGYPENVGHVGGVSYDKATSLGHLLSGADRILSSLQNQGANIWKVEPLSSEQTEMPHGEQEWRQIFDQVLSDKNISLYGQSVVVCSDLKKRMHVEILSRIILPTGQMLNAGFFIPLAERVQRISSVDRIVLEKVFQIEGGKLHTSELAVNISPSSLKDASFMTWVLSSLKNLPSGAHKIIFEFAEYNATQELEILRNFAKEVKALGHFIALDHFGQSFANFGYLKSIHPKYVKIDKAFSDELKAEGSDSHFFIGSLASVAHSLDILVIAEGVEDEKQYQTLCDLNIDGVQGYYIDKPEELVI